MNEDLWLMRRLSLVLPLLDARAQCARRVHLGVEVQLGGAALDERQLVVGVVDDEVGR